jgi:hypothetical protein
MALGSGGGAGWNHAYIYANCQAPQVHEGGNFHSSLTKDLQLKWGSVGWEEAGQGGEQGALNIKKSWTFPNSSLPEFYLVIE